MADYRDYQPIAEGLNSFVDQFITSYKESAKSNAEAQKLKSLIAQKKLEADEARQQRLMDRQEDRLWKEEQAQKNRDFMLEQARDRRAAVLTPEQKLDQPGAVFDRATLLRKEFQSLPETKVMADVTNAFEKMQKASLDPSAAGDITMIFNFMKLLDPNSTVREGEYANAQNAAGVPDQVLNLYNQVRSGERLNPTQRSQFLTQAKNNMDVHASRYNSVKQRYQSLADDYKVPSNLIFGKEPVPQVGSQPVQQTQVNQNPIAQKVQSMTPEQRIERENQIKKQLGIQ